MAKNQSTDFGFRIRPLEADEPAAPQPATPPPAAPPVREEPPAADALAHTGALFLSAQAALAFLGAVAGAGLAR